MIVHEVKIGKEPANQITKREHRKIYVGCAESDIRYRDMLVNFRHRWEFYTKPTIDFLTFDWNKSQLDQQKQAAKKIIHGSDGVMFIVSANTEVDSFTDFLQKPTQLTHCHEIFYTVNPISSRAKS